MIDLYTWTTPNAQKVSIMLEETALPYVVHPIDIEQGAQRRSEYLAVNPNGKVPAIVDRDGPGHRPLTVCESGAILVYLGEKTGQLLAREGTARAEALQWLMFQMASIGPTFHDAYHFMVLAPERTPHAIDYFLRECGRVLGVIDAHLGRHEYLAGDYSIADVATYPWIAAAVAGGLPGIDALGHLQRWRAAIAARPAVTRGMAVPA